MRSELASVCSPMLTGCVYLHDIRFNIAWVPIIVVVSDHHETCHTVTVQSTVQVHITLSGIKLRSDYAIVLPEFQVLIAEGMSYQTSAS